MKTFMKFNLISVLFGAYFLAGVKLLFNQIRGLSHIGLVVLLLMLFVAGTAFFLYISPGYLRFGKWMYLLVVSWIPYVRLFFSLFPITNPNISGGDGLVFGLMFYTYPIYVWFITSIGAAISMTESPEADVK